MKLNPHLKANVIYSLNLGLDHETIAADLGVEKNVISDIDMALRFARRMRKGNPKASREVLYANFRDLLTRRACGFSE